MRLTMSREYENVEQMLYTYACIEGLITRTTAHSIEFYYDKVHERN